jgi:holo-[acyl-carrier protein] synthase
MSIYKNQLKAAGCSKRSLELIPVYLNSSMLLGIGTDLCDSRRIAALLSRFDARFLNRVFTADERATCDRRPPERRILCYAKRFAAKEAFLKALGTGLVRGVAWQDMTVTLTPAGQPTLAAPRLLAARGWGDACVHLSLSDEPPYALAFVVISR